MSEELKYKVGDRVWVVFDRCSNPEYLSIAKYGRKWITLDSASELRFQIGSRTLEESKFGRIGAVYESKEQWETLSLAQLEAIDRIVEGQ